MLFYSSLRMIKYEKEKKCWIKSNGGQGYSLRVWPILPQIKQKPSQYLQDWTCAFKKWIEKYSFSVNVIPLSMLNMGPLAGLQDYLYNYRLTHITYKY